MPSKTETRDGRTEAIPEFLIAALDERWKRFARELARNRRRFSEPGIHDLRVATRRLMAVCALVRTVLPGSVRPKVARVLRNHLASFAPLRDLHVQVLMLRSLRRRFPAAGPMIAAMSTEEAALIRETARLILRFDAGWMEKEITGIHASLAAAARDCAALSAMKAVLIGSTGRLYLRVSVRRRAIQGSDPASIHRVRVAFKKYRYAVEALRPILHGVTGQEVKAMKKSQDRMGRIQDLDMVIARVRSFTALRRTGVTVNAHPLHRYLALRRRALIDEFVRDAGHIERFWFLPRASGLRHRGPAAR